MATLDHEFCNFSQDAKQLRAIVRDTRTCFKEINSIGHSNSNGQSPSHISAQFSDSEQQEIESSTLRLPTLVVLGRSTATRAVAANAVFQRPLLPVDDADAVRWRATTFRHGTVQSLHLSLPGSFELLDDRLSYDRSWTCVPVNMLRLVHTKDPANASAILDVTVDHPMLRDGGAVTVAPSCDDAQSTRNFYERFIAHRAAVIVYAFVTPELVEEDLCCLREILILNPGAAIFFVSVPPATTQCSNGNSVHQSDNVDVSLTAVGDQTMSPARQQLTTLGYLTAESTTRGSRVQDGSVFEVPHNNMELLDDFDNFAPRFSSFAESAIQSQLLQATSLLRLVHTRCLQTFVVSAFDMARDILVTPRRLEFARHKEAQLFESLMRVALLKQDEIRSLIGETIRSLTPQLTEKASDYNFLGVDLPAAGEAISSSNLKLCTGQIEDLMLGNLNRAIAGKLLDSVDVLRDSYTGVLTRCLESLEQSDKESMESARTSLALREILNAAYQVEITVRAGASLTRILIEKMKQLMQAMPWSTSPQIDEEWKRKVAADLLASLSETRLAKSICGQIKERLRQSHDAFSTALRQLEARHSGRLERTEDRRTRLRKSCAPRVAKLALESTSLRDQILYGTPTLGREVGRGQYGVVYACDSWGGFGPCAVKTVVPPDDKHWNDLALEFYYTKNVPDHDRIVALRGSVIDYAYSLAAPAVLLIMDRLEKDLYVAIKTNLDWLSRLQVALDVVEGIRFLHSQGLVHRDIKLKNVLLDRENRGKLTDLGFCKPEAMMSGSVVGTPIHMAPELFSGRYDGAVDVYAFAILFWYVCAGHTRLPANFEACHSKEMLWMSVKRGVRPERLTQFQDAAWQLMQECWRGDAQRRPLLGIVEPQLKAFMESQQVAAAAAAAATQGARPRLPTVSECDHL